MTGHALAAAAEALEGCRFRLHGRDPATGLDCIGVLAAALERSGRTASLPATYTMRTAMPGRLDVIAKDCGMGLASGPVRAGDVVLVRISACQFHLLLALGPARFIHAHAGLRRIVKHQGTPAWPIVGHWRFTEEGPD